MFGKIRNAVYIFAAGRKKGELFGFLAEYRDELLLKLHLCQRQIDCLDYFIYRIRKENKDNTVTGKSV